MKADTMERIVKGIYYKLESSQRLPTPIKIALVYTIAYPSLWICKTIVNTRITATEIRVYSFTQIVIGSIKIIGYKIGKWAMESILGIIYTSRYLAKKLFGKEG